MVNKGSRWNCLQLEVIWCLIFFMCVCGLICWDVYLEWFFFLERMFLLLMFCIRYVIVVDCRDFGSMFVGKYFVMFFLVYFFL